MTTKQLFTYAGFFIVAVLAICSSLVILKVLGNLLLILIGMSLTVTAWVLFGGKKKYPVKLFNRK